MRLGAALALSAAILGWGSAGAEPQDSPYAAVSLEESWDSNVLGSRGDDAVTRLTPRLGLLRESPRLQLGLDYRLGLHAYAAGKADDTVNHRGVGFARIEIDRRFHLDTLAQVIAADDPVVLDRPALAVPPGGIFEAQGAARLTTRITRRVEAQTGYSYRRSRFELAEGPMPLAFDGDEHRADLRASWRATRRLDTTLATRGQYFASAVDEVAVGQLAGVGWRATRTIRLGLEAGPVLYVPDAGATDATWLGDARAIWQGRRLRAGLVLLRELYGGTGAPQAVWSEQASAVLGWRVAHPVGLRLSAGMGRQGPAPNGSADATSLGGRGELRFAVGRQLRFDVFAEHRTQDVDGGIAFGDVDRTLAGVRLVGVIGTSLDDLAEVP